MIFRRDCLSCSTTLVISVATFSTRAELLWQTQVVVVRVLKSFQAFDAVDEIRDNRLYCIAFILVCFS